MRDVLARRAKFAVAGCIVFLWLLTGGTQFIPIKQKIVKTRNEPIEKQRTFETLVKTTFIANKTVLRAYEATRTNASLQVPFSPLPFEDIYPVVVKPVNSSSAVVLYNRVPKCASTTMINTLNYLKTKLKFRLVNVNEPRIKMFMDAKAQARMANGILELKSDAIFVRHLHFINFSRFGSKWPVYINVIRDPVERFISYYYYVRYGFQSNQGEVNKKWKLDISPERQNMPLEECVMKDPDKCVHTNSVTMLAFFCGQEKMCREYTDYALEKAKINAARYFTAIGLVEDLPNSFKIFHALLPRYFTTTALIDTPAKDTRTFMKEEPSPLVKSLLRKALRVDVEFYNFIKRRFYKQLDALVKNNLM